MMTAALAVLPVGPFAPAKARFDGRVLLAALGIAALSSALPYTLEMVALRVTPPRTFGVLMSLEPAVAAACGWMVLGEKLSSAQCVAIALIIAASAGATITVRRVDSKVEV
jgi:inner membrane transporter RhtA